MIKYCLINSNVLQNLTKREDPLERKSKNCYLNYHCFIKKYLVNTKHFPINETNKNPKNSIHLSISLDQTLPITKDIITYPDNNQEFKSEFSNEDDRTKKKTSNVNPLSSSIGIPDRSKVRPYLKRLSKKSQNLLKYPSLINYISAINSHKYKVKII